MVPLTHDLLGGCLSILYLSMSNIGIIFVTFSMVVSNIYHGNMCI